MNTKQQQYVGIGIMVASGLALFIQPAWLLIIGLGVILLSVFNKKK